MLIYFKRNCPRVTTHRSINICDLGCCETSFRSVSSARLIKWPRHLSSGRGSPPYKQGNKPRQPWGKTARGGTQTADLGGFYPPSAFSRLIKCRDKGPTCRSTHTAAAASPVCRGQREGACPGQRPAPPPPGFTGLSPSSQLGQDFHTWLLLLCGK